MDKIIINRHYSDKEEDQKKIVFVLYEFIKKNYLNLSSVSPQNAKTFSKHMQTGTKIT